MFSTRNGSAVATAIAIVGALLAFGALVYAQLADHRSRSEAFEALKQRCLQVLVQEQEHVRALDVQGVTTAAVPEAVERTAALDAMFRFDQQCGEFVLGSSLGYAAAFTSGSMLYGWSDHQYRDWRMRVLSGVETYVNDLPDPPMFFFQSHDFPDPDWEVPEDLDALMNH